MIYSSLSRGPWRRKPPRKRTPKREMYEERVRKVQAAKARERALAYGCEYADWLRAWYRRNGCAACSREDASGPHLHHTEHRSRRGRAETQVPLCPGCHVEDRESVEGRALSRHGVDLFAKAREFAAAGREQGWLPVEECAACGSWHSTRFLLDDIDVPTGITRRICEDCGGEGPR